jgi:hypothetical protein
MEGFVGSRSLNENAILLIFLPSPRFGERVRVRALLKNRPGKQLRAVGINSGYQPEFTVGATVTPLTVNPYADAGLV